MGSRARKIDTEIPIDRSQWFRERAFEVTGPSVFEAYGIEREAASLMDVALIAATALGVAHYHTSGVPLGVLIEWTQKCLGLDADRAFALRAYPDILFWRFSGGGVVSGCYEQSTRYRSGR